MVNIGVNKKNIKYGFSVLEVLVSLSILMLTLMALYNSFSTSIFILARTTNLWKAMSYAQNELLKYERATIPPNIQLVQGEFESQHPMNGYRWKKLVQDTKPLPDILIRQVKYQLFWDEGKHQYSYDADIYINPK